MANLLQQQLIKAGVATADQIKKGDRHKRGEDRRSPPPSDQQRLAQQKRQDADRERNRQQQEQRERKERLAQVRQIIESNRIDRKGGEAAYQFVEAGRIRKFYLHEAQRQQVVAGTLVVVRLGRNFELVLPEVADRIAERDPAIVLVRNGAAAVSADDAAASDPYAEFQVPDDLMW